MSEEIYESTLTILKPDFETFDIDTNPERMKSWRETVRLYLKRFLLLIDSRYSDRAENIRLVDAQNESAYYFTPDHLSLLYDAATQIHEGKKRGTLLPVLSIKDSVMDRYLNKPDEGFRLASMPKFSEHFRFTPGQMNVVTGIPSHGKSEFLDQILSRLAFECKLKFAIFSPENYPHDYHVMKLLSKLYNKSFFPTLNQNNRLTKNEIDIGLDFLDKHFVFLNPYENDISLEALLSLVLQAKEEKGVSAFVLDPWNDIEHNLPPNKTEVQYLNQSLTNVRRFGRTNELSPFIVAHPTKLLPLKPGEPFPIPTAYNINGGAMWFNKADNIMSVYRNNDDSVSVFIQKIKFKQFGKKGQVDFNYDFLSGTYTEK